MSLETILLIGVLTVLAIALGADCLWNLIIRSCLLKTSDSLEVSFTDRFLEMTVNVQRQTDRFLIVILSVVLTAAIALNIIPNSHLESYLIKIGSIGLIVVLLLISVEFIQINQDVVERSTVANISLGIRLIAEIVAYWSFLHYAINPRI